MIPLVAVVIIVFVAIIVTVTDSLHRDLLRSIFLMRIADLLVKIAILRGWLGIIANKVGGVVGYVELFPFLRSSVQ